MGALFDFKKTIEAIIKARNLNEYKIKGQIVLKTGFTLTLINENTPDDPVRINKLKKAMEEILHI